MVEIVHRATEPSERVHDAWVAHHERLWRAVLAWSGDAEVAHDAVAEAFAQAVRRGDAVEDVGRWVWRAAFRIAAGLLGDRRRHGGGPVADRPAEGTVPEEAAVLVDALDRLPPPDRLVVVLALVGDLPSAEIADLTGSTPGAVRVRLHRARATLRRALEDDRA